MKSSIAEHMAGMAQPRDREGSAPQHGAQEGEQSGVHGHLAAMHKEMGGKHMHIHQGEEGVHTTHHVDEDGQVQGPHEHGDVEALKAHVHHVFGQGEHGPKAWAGGGESKHESGGGGHESLFG